MHILCTCITVEERVIAMAADGESAGGLAAESKYGTIRYWPEQRLKVCVTGAGGFIGSHTAKRLKAEGHYVIACDWKRNEHMPVRYSFLRLLNDGKEKGEGKKGE